MGDGKWRPGGKSPLVRPRLRWEDKVTVNLQEVGWTEWTGSIWLRIWARGWVLMNTVIKALYDPAEACSTNGGEER